MANPKAIEVLLPEHGAVATLHLECARAAYGVLPVEDGESWRAVEPDGFDCDGCEAPISGTEER